MCICILGTIMVGEKPDIDEEQQQMQGQMNPNNPPPQMPMMGGPPGQPGQFHPPVPGRYHVVNTNENAFLQLCIISMVTFKGH